MKDDKKKKKKRTLVNVTEIGRRFFWIRSLPKPVVFGFYHCATLFIALLLNEMLMKSSLVLFRVLRERIRLWTVYNAIFAKEVKKTMTTKKLEEVAGEKLHNERYVNVYSSKQPVWHRWTANTYNQSYVPYVHHINSSLFFEQHLLLFRDG